MEKRLSKVGSILNKVADSSLESQHPSLARVRSGTSELLRELRAAREQRHTQSEIQDLQDRIQELTWEVRSRDSKIKTLENSNKEAQSELVAKTSALEMTLTELNSSKAHIQDQQRKIATLEDQETHQNEVGKELEATQGEVAALKAQIKEYQNLEAQRFQAEERLRFYAQHLSHTKSDLATKWRELADELSQASVLHPLKDLLEWTRKECLRLEDTLKCTPTLSSERTGLERRTRQLLEQREYLDLMIRAAEDELKRKGERAQRQASTLEGQGVPPPPRGPERITG